MMLHDDDVSIKPAGFVRIQFWGWAERASVARSNGPSVSSSDAEDRSPPSLTGFTQIWRRRRDQTGGLIESCTSLKNFPLRNCVIRWLHQNGPQYFSLSKYCTPSADFTRAASPALTSDAKSILITVNVLIFWRIFSDFSNFLAFFANFVIIFLIIFAPG